MQITIPRSSLRAVACFAARRDIRDYLCGVLVEIGRDSSRLVATDGHVLGMMHLDDGARTMEVVSAILPIDDVRKIKRSGADLSLTVDQQNSTGKQYATLDDGVSKLTFPCVEGRFPDYRRVTPETVSGETAQFNPELLARFSDAAAEIGTKKSAVWVGHNGAGPALVEISGRPDFLGVIMPMRHEKAEIPAGRPSWVTSAIVPYLAVAA